jgi:hypothetical protein
MNVSVTVNREKERAYMKTFTIDNDNNITAFPTPDHAEAAVGVGAQPFTSQKQLAELASAWPPERLVEIWNSLPGVEPVKGFKSVKAAASPSANLFLAQSAGCNLHVFCWAGGMKSRH